MKRREKKYGMIPNKLPWATGRVTVLLNKIEDLLGWSEKSNDLCFGQNEIKMLMGYPMDNFP